MRPNKRIYGAKGRISRVFCAYMLALQIVASDSLQDIVNGILSLELLTFGLGLAAIVTSAMRQMSFPNGSVVASLLACVRRHFLLSLAYT